MGIAQAQAPASSENIASASARTQAWGSNVTAGNLLLVAITTNQNATDTVALSDTLGNTYAQVGTYSTRGTGRSSLWAVITGSSGANTVTVTPNVSTEVSIAVHEYSGVLSATPDATVTANAAASTSWTSTTCAVNNPNEMVFAVFGGNPSGQGTVTATGGATLRASQGGSSSKMGLATLDNIGVSSGTAITCTVQTSVGNMSVAASFQPAGGGPAFIPQPPLIVGQAAQAAIF